MEGKIQNMKISKRDLLMALIALPVFVLGYYIIAIYTIQIIELILYPTKFSLIVLGIKLLAIISIAFVIFVSILIAICYYKVVRALIRAYRITHNKI